jgi:3-oxoacyl-[acyl-carrier protein] reductase
MDYLRLGPPAGTRAIVIGGCGGIGRCYVRGLLAAGCRVAVLDRDASISQFPPPTGSLAIALDATDEAALRAAFAQVEEAFGGLDVMAHLAGINGQPVSIADTDLADFDRVIAINLRTALLASQLAIGIMRRSSGGVIVLTSSGLAVNPEPHFGAYSMSKAGLIALAKTISKEGAPTIRANAVAPGAVDTAFLAGGTGSGNTEARNPLQDSPEMLARILASIPMGRIATPEDIAGPMLFLSGEASRYMTGQVLYINGGRLMP